jgi:hypothetical protein
VTKRQSILELGQAKRLRRRGLLEKAKALGHRNAPTVTENIRDTPSRDRPTNLSRFHRRLTRLSETVERESLNDTQAVFDFKLFQSPASRYGAGDRQDWQRNGATDKSVVFLETNTDGRYTVREFCLRLPDPKDTAWTTIIDKSLEIAKEASPPVQGVKVWLRPPGLTLKNVPQRGEQLNDGSPHIGIQDTAIHPTAFIEYVTDALNGYLDTFEPKSRYSQTNRGEP